MTSERGRFDGFWGLTIKIQLLESGIGTHRTMFGISTASINLEIEESSWRDVRVTAVMTGAYAGLQHIMGIETLWLKDILFSSSR